MMYDVGRLQVAPGPEKTELPCANSVSRRIMMSIVFGKISIVESRVREPSKRNHWAENINMPSIRGVSASEGGSKASTHDNCPA